MIITITIRTSQAHRDCFFFILGERAARQGRAAKSGAGGKSRGGSQGRSRQFDKGQLGQLGQAVRTGGQGG